MKVNRANQIWQFDIDDTLIMWDKSKYPQLQKVLIPTKKGVAEVHKNEYNCNLLKKLAKLGWYIRVHSGSGVAWAKLVVETLGLEEYVDEVAVKPRGETDDQPPGDGLAYRAYRDPIKGGETT